MTHGADASRLREIPLFRELDGPALERVAALATEVEFPPGSVLAERGQPGSGMFVVLEGRVSVQLPHGAVELGPGEFVGERSLLVDEVQRHARVCAATPVRCLAIARNDFALLLDSEPKIAVSMLPSLARRLAGMIHDSRS